MKKLIEYSYNNPGTVIDAMLEDKLPDKAIDEMREAAGIGSFERVINKFTGKTLESFISEMKPLQEKNRLEMNETWKAIEKKADEEKKPMLKKLLESKRWYRLQDPFNQLVVMHCVPRYRFEDILIVLSKFRESDEPKTEESMVKFIRKNLPANEHEVLTVTEYLAL